MFIVIPLITLLYYCIGVLFGSKTNCVYYDQTMETAIIIIILKYLFLMKIDLDKYVIDGYN